MNIGLVFVAFLMAINLASAAAFQFTSDTPRILWQDYKTWIIGGIAVIFALFILYFVFTSRFFRGYFEEKERQRNRESLRRKLGELSAKQSVGISLSAG